MTRYLQYDTMTGAINAETGSHVPAENFPPGVAEITYEGEEDISFLRVNLGTMEIEVFYPEEGVSTVFNRTGDVVGEEGDYTTDLVTEGEANLYFTNDRADTRITALMPTTFDDLTDGSTNKAYTGTEKTKLSGIATGATANSSDATLISRTNHTGSQAISTVTGLQTALDGKQVTISAAAHIADGATNGAADAPTNAPADARTDYGTLAAVLGAEVNTNNGKQNSTATNVNALAVKYNALAGKYNDLATKVNTIFDHLEAQGLQATS